MKAKEIIQVIEKYIPLESQEEWDRSGIQIGNINQEVHKVMISLNCDKGTVKACMKQGCQMLITHHPFLLDKVDNYSTDSFIGQVLEICYKNNIVVYSTHTSLDNTYMNKWLIEALDIYNHFSLPNFPMCEVGELNTPLSKDDFIMLVQNKYHLSHLKYAGHKETISKVAVLGGSGADLIEDLYDKVDAFITGDTKYRHAKNAFDHDILLVDVNHHSESIMIHKLKELIENEVSVDIVEYHADDYYTYL